jgi:hypothetical protein
MKKSLLFILLATTSCTHANPIYRWRDAQGHLHFDESKPLNQKYETVDEKSLPLINTATAPAASENSTTKKSSRTKNSVKKSNKKTKSVEAAQKRCRRYDEQLDNIANRLRAGYREPTGNHLRAKRRQLEQRVRDEC